MGILINKNSRKMVPRKARDRKIEDNRKARDWRFRSRIGGPYKGSCGKRGCVWGEGLAVLRDSPGLTDWPEA